MQQNTFFFKKKHLNTCICVIFVVLLQLDFEQRMDLTACNLGKKMLKMREESSHEAAFYF